jgi:predicted nucleic acid-binding protein
MRILFDTNILIRAQAYVDELRRDSVIVTEIAEKDDIPCRDPDDKPIVSAAMGGSVDVLCTNDKDLLTDELSMFLASHGIAVLTDIDFLKLLRGE